MRVEARDLTFSHPASAPLFQSLNFVVSSGELIAVVGPSGSGKSTLLSLLGGWLTASSGSLDISGVDRTALVPQNPYGVTGRTALDHVSLPLVATGISRSSAEGIARETLRLLRLDKVGDRPYRMLSGGERQRMLLARALASAPDMLLVDEPTAQLDSSSAMDVSGALARLGEARVTTFVATHDARVVEICSGVIDLLSVVAASPTHRRQTPPNSAKPYATP